MVVKQWSVGSGGGLKGGCCWSGSWGGFVDH